VIGPSENQRPFGWPDDPIFPRRAFAVKIEKLVSMHLLISTLTAAFLATPNLADKAKEGVVSLAAMIVILGVLVFVHEFGHYAVAKLCGVRVEIFSLGFGKRLWGFRRGDTDYRISLLPLGGFVKMTGENPMEERTGDPGEFTSHPRWQRFLIAIAGPAMNVVLAIVVLTVVYMIHDEEYAFLSQPAVIRVVDPGSPADKAGIKPGDRIARIQKLDNPTWQQVIPEVAINPDQPVEVTLQRGNESIHTKVVPKPEGPERAGYAGFWPRQPVLVGELSPDVLVAKAAGMKTGDEIVSFNGKPVENMPQFIDMLQEAKSVPVQIGVLRGGAQLQFTVVPQLADDATGEKRYRIGFLPLNPMRVQRLPFRDALSKSLASCKEYSSLLFRLVPKLIEGKNSIRQMSGPVGIMRESGRVAMEGNWWDDLKFLAMLSVSLAVLNILPFPILDGGLMLMLLIEGAIRRDIKVEIKERLYYAAFVCLVLFAAVITYFDVAKSFHS
jgi:regulator of sigma E protease